MLGLDDARWGELEHAYGKAGDTPTQLEALRACEILPSRWQDEPLSSLWESLCHQGDPCTAAFAAVPHLVDIVAARPAGEGKVHAAYRKWASDLGHAAVAQQIADLDGTFLCPGCGRELRATDAIVTAYP